MTPTQQPDPTAEPAGEVEITARDLAFEIERLRAELARLQSLVLHGEQVQAAYDELQEALDQALQRVRLLQEENAGLKVAIAQAWQQTQTTIQGVDAIDPVSSSGAAGETY